MFANTRYWFVGKRLQLESFLLSSTSFILYDASNFGENGTTSKFIYFECIVFTFLPFSLLFLSWTFQCTLGYLNSTWSLFLPPVDGLDLYGYKILFEVSQDLNSKMSKFWNDIDADILVSVEKKFWTGFTTYIHLTQLPLLELPNFFPQLLC